MPLFFSSLNLLANLLIVVDFALLNNSMKNILRKAEDLGSTFIKSGKYFNIDKLQLDMVDDISQPINLAKLEIFLAS